MRSNIFEKTQGSTNRKMCKEKVSTSLEKLILCCPSLLCTISVLQLWSSDFVNKNGEPDTKVTLSRMIYSKNGKHVQVFLQTYVHALSLNIA
jgi:hypothetical protein